MSRADVPAAADWSGPPQRPGVVLAEADQDTTACHQGHIKGAIKIGWKEGRLSP
jgi:thiosulfate/3-mercaptopyruvate sulfurtransferase